MVAERRGPVAEPQELRRMAAELRRPVAGRRRPVAEPQEQRQMVEERRRMEAEQRPSEVELLPAP